MKSLTVEMIKVWEKQKGFQLKGSLFGCTFWTVHRHRRLWTGEWEHKSSFKSFSLSLIGHSDCYWESRNEKSVAVNTVNHSTMAYFLTVRCHTITSRMIIGRHASICRRACVTSLQWVCLIDFPITIVTHKTSYYYWLLLWLSNVIGIMIWYLHSSFHTLRSVMELWKYPPVL